MATQSTLRPSTSTKPPNDKTAATDQPRPIQAVSSVPSQSTTQFTEIPLRLFSVEAGQPFYVINSDPALEVQLAAIFLGVSHDLLEKWRQRD